MSVKRVVEILLVEAKLTSAPERRLLRSRNLLSAELVWPRAGIARKSAAREVKFRQGVADFTAEEWTKRCVFREEVDGHCGIAVAVTEPVSVQKLKRWARLTARGILRAGADAVQTVGVGYGDIAAAPLDALATMVGEKDAPKLIAQGVIDCDELPRAGEMRRVPVPLSRPATGAAIGTLMLEVRVG